MNKIFLQMYLYFLSTLRQNGIICVHALSAQRPNGMQRESFKWNPSFRIKDSCVMSIRYNNKCSKRMFLRIYAIKLFIGCFIVKRWLSADWLKALSTSVTWPIIPSLKSAFKIVLLNISLFAMRRRWSNSTEKLETFEGLLQIGHGPNVVRGFFGFYEISACLKNLLRVAYSLCLVAYG